MLPNVLRVAPRPPRTPLPLTSLPSDPVSPQHWIHSDHRGCGRSPLRPLLSHRPVPPLSPQPGTLSSPPPRRSLLTFSRPCAALTPSGKAPLPWPGCVKSSPCSHSSNPASRQTAFLHTVVRVPGSFLLGVRPPPRPQLPLLPEGPRELRRLSNHLGPEVTLTSLLPNPRTRTGPMASPRCRDPGNVTPRGSPSEQHPRIAPGESPLLCHQLH